MPEIILDGRGTSNTLLINPDGSVNISGTIDINNINGSIIIGSVSASVDSIYVQSGVMNIQDEVPTDSNKNNPAWSFDYDANGNVGSILQFIGAGSYVQKLSWANGSVLTDIGSWS